MAEHPVIMPEKQIRVVVQKPGMSPPAVPAKTKDPVVENTPKVSDGKKSLAQRLSKYSFGEEMEKPGKYIFDSYLEPTGKRVANDIVEYFLTLIKHTFQRWIWNGKILDNGKWMDRTSYSDISRQQQQPVKAMVLGSPVKELTFQTRIDAQRVLNELKDTIKQEGHVTVRQYYEASSCPELCESSGTASSNGWTNLEKAEVKDSPGGEGFCISLPRPVSLVK